MNRPQPDPNSTAVRLQKLLAEAGFGSRRACEEYVTAGRVTIDGEIVAELGARVDPERQEVRVDGQLLRIEPKRYYLVNKPEGVLCTNSDPRGRPRVIDLLPDGGPRLYPVGRLDENSRGLILVTNDGELANKLLHPRYRVPRSYRVQVAGEPTNETLDGLVKGLHFGDGRFRIRSYRRLGTRGRSTNLEFVLTEGRNREIRRLMARVGHKVMTLERVGFGPLKLGRLKAGDHRPLTRREIDSLLELVTRRSEDGSKNKPSKKAARKRAGTGSRQPGRSSDSKPKRVRKKAATKKTASKKAVRGKRTGRRGAGR